jgi:hypothetical protein
MSFAEVTLNCNSCSKNFIFTVIEHDLRASKGYPNEPLLCPSCRQARNSRRAQSEYSTKKSVPSGGFFR